MQGLRGLRVLALCAAATAALSVGAPVATAQGSFPCSQEGDPCGEVVAGFASPGGVSVAFAPTVVNTETLPVLWYTNLGDPNLYRVTTAGVDLPPILVKGALPIQSLTYDATRDHFWGVDLGVNDLPGFTYNVYEIDKRGNARLRFVAVLPDCDNGSPSTEGDQPGPCDQKLDGIAYDARTDSLWFSPDTSQRIYHFTTTGILLGHYDSNQPGEAMTSPKGSQPFCATNYNSGIAVGAPETTAGGAETGRSIMYLMNPDCGPAPFTWFSYLSDDANMPIKQNAYSTYDGQRPEDNECDSITFSKNVIWVRDEVDNVLRAFKANPCVFGGGLVLPTAARMTGGGDLPMTGLLGAPTGATVHIGLIIHCSADMGVKPNHLTVTWGEGNSFHGTLFPDASCNDTGKPKSSGTNFDTIGGTVSGRCKLKNSSTMVSATATFSFTDGGEGADATSPSTDTGTLTISGGCAVTASGMPVPDSLQNPLDGEGNFQAHGQAVLGA